MSTVGPRPPLQALVRETMLLAGGYWRPLAAVARLLEELGELAELPAAGTPHDKQALAGELADLWIITTALADQFLAEVPEPGQDADARPEPSLSTLVSAAGPLARVVNHYDGPKVPREGTALPSLAEAVADFHRALGALAAAREVDLPAAVAEKIELIHGRGDIERFARDGFDPSTAPILERVRGEDLPERLWGAPDAGTSATARRRAELAREPLAMFAKAARAERLEGFVIAGPPLIAGAGPDAWIGGLVAELDPEGDAAALRVAGVALHAEVLLAGDGGRAGAGGVARDSVAGRALALLRPAGT